MDRKHGPNLGALRQAAEFPISQEILKPTKNLIACYLQNYCTFSLLKHTLTNLS